MPANIEALLAPVSAETPCGADLEYDAGFAALDRATQGKPEQQIGATIIPAEEPDWKAVSRQAVELMGRTKDLRVAVYLTKGLLHTEGLKGFADGLTVLQRLLETYWEGLFPRLDPDDGNDPTMRFNILSTLTAADVLSAVRAAPMISSRTVGRFSYRDLEAATAAPADGSGGTTVATIEAAGLDADLEGLQQQAAVAQAATAAVKQIEAVIGAIVGPGVGPSFATLAALLQKISGFLQSILGRRVPSAAGGEAMADGVAVPAVNGAPAAGGSFSGEIRSREDVVRALDRISAYYARNEPSSPLPLLVDRCKRLVTMGFMDIIRDLAPDGVRQVETLSGQKQE
ncbi:MAG TPA: type VI secretion system protein TssA [Polyangia bacterium]|nr:type VI secretion system protein TssA [Polyangia bacterium]